MDLFAYLTIAWILLVLNLMDHEISLSLLVSSLDLKTCLKYIFRRSLPRRLRAKLSF